MRLQWSPLALDRVSEIAGYIAQNDPFAANKWAQSIFDRVKQTKDFPKSGRSVPEINRRDIRELIHGNYRIIYRIERKAVSILTVRHFRQILPIDDIQNTCDQRQ